MFKNKKKTKMSIDLTNTLEKCNVNELITNNIYVYNKPQTDRYMNKKFKIF